MHGENSLEGLNSSCASAIYENTPQSEKPTNGDIERLLEGQYKSL